jgi:hypothetical protein
MKRGYAILISGAVLLVAGIAISAIWGFSFAGSFLRENTIVAKTIIDPGKSVSAATNINQLDKPISLAIGIDRNGQPSGAFSDARLRETVTDPNDKVVSNNEFVNSFFTSFTTKMAGVYTVTVTNLSAKPVTISGTFGHIPFIGTNGKPDIGDMAGGQGLGMIIAGGGLDAAGIITLIAGGIVMAVDSGGKPSTSSTTTNEGGITYRKD